MGKVKETKLKCKPDYRTFIHSKFVIVYIALCLALLINQIVFSFLLTNREQASAAVVLGNNVPGINTYPGVFTKIAEIAGYSEEYLKTAVVDETNNFAYSGTMGGSAGSIIKIDLNTFTKVGSLTLNDGESQVSASAIDTANGYAYFAINTSPVQIVKVNLNTFTRVDAINLKVGNGTEGENTTYSMLIDTVNHLLYVATNQTPSKVVKIDLTTFTRVSALTLDTGENYVRTGFIDTVNDFAYFVTWTSPAKVVKIDLTTFTRDSALTLDAGENSSWSSAIDAVNSYAYIATNTNPTRIVKIDLATFTRDSALTLNAGENSARALTLDLVNINGYVLTGTTPGIIVKVDLTTMTRTLAILLSTNETSWSNAAFIPGDGYLYQAVGNQYVPNKILKIDLATFTRDSEISLIPGATYSRGVIDEVNGYAYYAVSTKPGKIVKIDLNTNTLVDQIILDLGEDSLIDGAIDKVNGYAYFVTSIVDPAKIIKIDIDPARTFVRIGTLTLNAGESQVNAAVLDSVNSFVYFVTGGAAGNLIKIDLATFTRVPVTLTLPWVQTGVIDEANGFAYFAALHSPADIYKVDLSTDTLAGTINLPAGEDYVYSSLIDTVNHYAYFGTQTTPARVIKVDLSTFTRDSAFICNIGDNSIYKNGGVLNPNTNYAYFSTGQNPGHIIKVDLSTFTQDSTYIASSGILLGPALLDTINNNVYFTRRVAPNGSVIKYADNFSTKKGFLVATKTTLSETINIDYFSFYSHLADGNLRLALYQDIGQKYLIWQSNVIANTVTNGWLNINVSNGQPATLEDLSPGTYWFVWQTDSNNNVASYAAGASGDGLNAPYEFGSFPLAIPNFSSTAEIWSMYGGVVVRPSSGAFEPVSAAPVNLTCQPLSSDTIRWTFEDTATDEKGFRLYGPKGLIWESGPEIITDLSYIDETGLNPETLYEDRYVIAFSGAGESEASNLASCSTLAVSSEEELNLILHDPAPAALLPEGVEIGTAVKSANSDTVYFIDQDNRRHAFPSESVYFSYYPDFSDIQTVSSATMAAIPLASNVTMRPGTWLVKIQTDPKVYAVEPYGVLKWVSTVEIATILYGVDWDTKIADVVPTFFVNYQLGSAITTASHPTGSAFSYENDVKVYYIEQGKKRYISTESFLGNKFQDQFIIRNISNLITYETGVDLPVMNMEQIMTLR